ncbi:peptidase M20 family protein (homolog to succinyl-diaminopimelate desuccinylase) [Halobacterium hubeiense]|uniref:Peptidase M20 family protein (Homolog to succinyl-diaminopimelate desuccinylase) n=1 Tax=Halobacterium hubeiense TaxID=1407499 RepID=A0A0U5AA70_9EURY|nr:M20/M25/M40 family metallo-hydrolase [Halobacterium hubeiense]CQH45421.1 peptidase M20 family protein (homolog to succinyl-diaminopimelate desuccinylase) [Halobacterium hubeiense]
MSELRDLTERLVSIPSHDDETAAGDAIASWLREHTAADVTRDDAGNVIAWRNRDADGDSLALVGHHDVVPPDETQVEDGDYVVYEDESRIYGRGTADMKGAVAAMLLAFRDADPDGPLAFASFAGEELGGVGVQQAIDEGFAPDYAVVGEGSTGYSADGTLDVAVAHKGRRASTVTAAGEAAHASEVESGENAVYRACDAVDVLRDLDAPEADVLGQHLAGSVAVTEIEGGSAWNVIPESCEVTVDERTVPGERADVGAVEAVEGVSWTVEQDLPPMACDDAAFADGVLDAVREVQDGAGEHVAKPHATDAGWLAAAGTTCLVCGPAEQGEAHTADESVSLDVLERCKGVYRRAADAVPGGQS